MTNSAKDDIISPFHDAHDHSHCQHEALERARQQCLDMGLRLTPIRQQVLEIVWLSHQPVGAYDVLQALETEGHKPAPPTAYRALDFLVNAKLIHRVESLNAYIGCPSPNASHQSQFFICKSCSRVAEANDPKMRQAISQAATNIDFCVQQPIIEIHGLCKHCQSLVDQ